MQVDLSAWAHDPSDAEVYIDPALIPGAREGDLAEVWQPPALQPDDEGRGRGRRSRRSVSSSKSARAHSAVRNMANGNATTAGTGNDSNGSNCGPGKRNLYFLIRKPPKPANVPAVSVNSQVLASLGIRRRTQVCVRLVEYRPRVTLDVVEIHFSGVYLTRDDHYKIAKSVSGKCLFKGQRVSYLSNSVRLNVECLYREGKHKFSGYVGDETRIVFRSDSARILIFVQMSSEMWNFDEMGDIMFHRLVNSFIPEMFHRWHGQGDSHLVSIILFTSVAVNFQEAHHHHSKRRLEAGELEESTLHFYRVVVDSVHISRWSDIMDTLRKEFERFPKEVLIDPETYEIRGEFLPSSKSNLLEAFSLATTLLTNKFIDRDLCRTGVQAMVVTAGPACFDVDLRELWVLSRRLLGVEIGIELVCLAMPPLHITPLFRAKLPALPPAPTNASRLVFCVPTWINISFWSSPDRYKKQWIPQCKIYDLQMVGIIENESRTLALRSFNFEPNDLTSQFMKRFDASVFKSVETIESEKRVESAAKLASSSDLRPQPNVQRVLAASAVTTVAVARPTLAQPLPQPTLTPVDVEVEPTSPVMVSPTSPDIAAKASLGALLGISNKSGRSRSSTTSVGSHPQQPLPQLPTSQVRITELGENLDAPELGRLSKLPIYVQSPTRAVTRRESKSRLLPRLSPLTRWPGGSPWHGGSPQHGKPNNVSPGKERMLGSVSPHNSSNIANAVVNDGMLPEVEHKSMWRVLPNSATIDNPSLVTAYGRWANVYHPNRKLNGVSWHSLKSPASLPVTSESFPGLSSFTQNYQFQFYDVAVDSDEMPLPLLLEEMIGLRLRMGFQIAVGPDVRAVEASLPRGNPNKVVVTIPPNARECTGLRIYLTRVGLVHRMAVDDSNVVNMRLYTWIDGDSNRLRAPGRPQRRTEDVKVKTRHDNEYLPINKQFLDPKIESLNWSMLDLQVSGADDPLLYPSSGNTQNLVTIRYVVIPTDSPSHIINNGVSSSAGCGIAQTVLSIEEGYVEGITRIVRSLLKNREGGSIDADFLPQYYTGQLSRAISEYMVPSTSILGSNRLNKQISLQELAVEMQRPMGIPFKDRRWHWKYFKSVFLGHDFVVWLVKTFEDISSTDDALAYGVDLMKRGLFRHPENRHPFLNGHYFYEMAPQFVESDNINEKSAGDAVEVKNLERKDNKDKMDKHRRAKVHVSGSFVMNVDPRGISARPERVKVSIDRTHNPKNAYHILLEWLNVTPRLVDDYFSSLGRLASQYGLKIVQVPVADVSMSLEDSPFRSALTLKLNIELDGDEEEQRWFRHYILRKSSYTLDVHDRKDISTDEYEVLFMWGRLRSALPQYIHNSGYILVQLDNDGTLKLTPNTLHLSRAVLSGSSTSNAEQDCEMFIGALSELCQNRTKLEDMLAEGRERRANLGAALASEGGFWSSNSSSIDLSAGNSRAASPVDSYHTSSARNTRPNSRRPCIHRSRPPMSGDSPSQWSTPYKSPHLAPQSPGQSPQAIPNLPSPRHVSPHSLPSPGNP